MDWAWVMFGLLLAMCVVVGVAFTIEETPNEVQEDGTVVYLGHGTVHEQFSSMNVGGPGAERHKNILWVGGAFGLLQCVFFVICLVFGSRKRGTAGILRTPILIGGVIYVAVFAAMIFSYGRFVDLGSEIPLFLSFPRPTAWMMYGVWGFPFYFLILYIVTFDRWTCRPEDLEEFKNIMAKSSGATAEETA